MGIKVLVLVSIFLISLFIVPAYSLQCPDGAYIGRDNQGNEACRDIKTNKIIAKLTSPVVAPSSNQPNQPSSSNQNPVNNSSQGIIYFVPIIIILIVIIAIIAVASRRIRSSNAMYIPSNFGQDYSPQIYSKDAIGSRKQRTEKQRTNTQRTQSKQIRAGKKGENLVMNKLSQLDDGHHIFSDVNIAMNKYITYNDERNLRTAQIDFVVVSKKGVFVIEVKNWSRGFLKQKQYFSPHEQVHRASRLLWIALKSSGNPSVTSVLLSMGGIMRSDPKYKYVFVTDLEGINDFLQGGNDNLSQQDVDRIRKKMDDFARS